MPKKRAKSPEMATDNAAATTDQGLLSTILAKPGDDAPRLAYADWLALNGQSERADFIRLQIERSRLPRRDPARIYPGERERALLAAHAVEWLAPLPEAARRTVRFERGFPGRAEVEIVDFLSWNDDLWQVAPVTTLRLVDTVLASGGFREGMDKEREMRALAAKPQLAYLRTLDLTESGYFVLADLNTLLTSPHLASLHQLIAADIGAGPPKWGTAGDKIVQVLDRAKDLAGLRVLSLESTGITDAGVTALLSNGLLPQLTELVLSNNSISDEGTERLASSPRLAKLEYLHLFCNCIGDRGAHALAASTHLQHLKGISLMANDIGAEAQAVLRERFGDRLEL